MQQVPCGLHNERDVWERVDERTVELQCTVGYSESVSEEYA